MLINAKKLENTKDLENKLNTLVLSTAVGQYQKLKNGTSLLLKFFFYPTFYSEQNPGFAVNLYAVEQQGELNAFFLVNLTEP